MANICPPPFGVSGVSDGYKEPTDIHSRIAHGRGHGSRYLVGRYSLGDCVWGLCDGECCPLHIVGVTPMKAILEFTLPADDWEFQQARQGAEYRAVLSQTIEALRRYRKGEHPPKVQEMLADIWTELWAILDEAGVAQEFA